MLEVMILDALSSRLAEVRSMGQVLMCCFRVEVKVVSLFWRDVRMVLAWADSGEKGSLV